MIPELQIAGLAVQLRGVVAALIGGVATTPEEHAELCDELKALGAKYQGLVATYCIPVLNEQRARREL